MKKIPDKFYRCINSYFSMDILGMDIHCPYWANHIKNGAVTERGYAEGKGKADAIRNEIICLVSRDQKEKPGKKINRENIMFLARQNRVGIDCSGFAFRIMEAVIEKKDLELMFPSGIRKTNAEMFTHNSFSQKIDSLKEIAIGDLIRLNSGHHVAIIILVGKSKIHYVHSSSRTEITGVHKGEIIINNPNEKIENQLWREKTLKGENWMNKYFHSEEGDGIYRNKILHRMLNQ